MIVSSLILDANAFLLALVLFVHHAEAGGGAVSTASSCRSCKTILGPVVDNVDNQCVQDCHSHTAPCLEDMFFYPNSRFPGQNLQARQIGGSNSPLLMANVDVQAVNAHPPPVYPFPQSFLDCLQSYAVVGGSCSGYTKSVPKTVYKPTCTNTPPTINVPWTLECSYTIETAKGNLMIEGSIPSAEQCLATLLNPVFPASLLSDYLKGYVANTDSLVGKCCADFAITTGTDSYCSAKGSVRVCQILPPQFNNEGYLNDFKALYCESTGYAQSIETGASLNFDGMKGCEKHQCCDGPNAVCG